MLIHVSAVNRVQEIRKDCENFSKRQASLEFRLLTNTLPALYFWRLFENYQRKKKKTALGRKGKKRSTTKNPPPPPGGGGGGGGAQGCDERSAIMAWASLSVRSMKTGSILWLLCALWMR